MRILIIEDEPGISGFLKQGLEEEAYAVDIADNGKKGLEMALEGYYDILLVDWMLPGMSGIEITRQFRKEYPSTPILFLTAKDTSDEAIFALQTGANDYIRKPFNFEELLARIRVQFRSRSDDQLSLSLGPINLFTENHRVEINGKEVVLTQKEFALLEYLIRHKNKVCRRSRIIESVWDIHFDYDTGVIDVFINSLRKKLGLTKDNNYIQTIRGVGYMAREE
ncbi:response regulator transcription factor [Cyclobacterium marinum]|uniref:Two component transcriptional regulator, winged helix family n=1 Tax=Cyclobacterium marinum (strain ATCC 25205 / DSM 745 / LMG 13164 / NCIMB 1802) TaxID=880070 RepID=G0J7J2_CYCMS|nr:response regulator transcription factor [Cyclobacterium marinum]AEL26945.1 two component transcriptional regulator, winged helix family [Cyclobacterium marinum DSM 745]MBI0400255.1 response regulator transcription factor [Cyclobacterium marinum]MBR9773658.1 response regulator transcription factor [Cytophagales bacterium]|tara:strand:- start:25739 stop:26407 length:669 start_codon:yes stop_codon:yes gene_type:complete